jgi:hypothetical protein
MPKTNHYAAVAPEESCLGDDYLKSPSALMRPIPEIRK